MVSAPPKPKPERPPMQQPSLLPEIQGDRRLLIPGFAGELSDDEFDFTRDQLLRDRHLARLWGFKPSAKRRPEQTIRALAEHGDPSRPRDNAKLARQPIAGVA